MGEGWQLAAPPNSRSPSQSLFPTLIPHWNDTPDASEGKTSRAPPAAQLEAGPSSQAQADGQGSSSVHTYTYIPACTGSGPGHWRGQAAGRRHLQRAQGCHVTASLWDKVPADTAGASLPPALSLAGGPWVAHLTSLSFSPSLPTKTPRAPPCPPFSLAFDEGASVVLQMFRPRWMILTTTGFTIVFYSSRGAWHPRAPDGETELQRSLRKTTRLRIRDRPRCG